MSHIITSPSKTLSKEDNIQKEIKVLFHYFLQIHPLLH